VSHRCLDRLLGRNWSARGLLRLLRGVLRILPAGDLRWRGGDTRCARCNKCGAPRSPGRPVQSCVAPGHWRISCQPPHGPI